jgi:hypothetical protein
LEQISALDQVHSLKRLKEAFVVLVSLASKQFKLCFFIDGLDEYEGSDSDGPEVIINVLTDIQRSPYLKIYLSSRPRFEFEEAFKNGSVFTSTTNWKVAHNASTIQVLSWANRKLRQRSPIKSERCLPMGISRRKVSA